MTDPQSYPKVDCVLPFAIEGLGIRGRLVRMGPELGKLLDPHQLPGAVRQALGETIGLSAALASALKFDGVFTLQSQTNGPVNLMVADITSAGDIRAYARYDETRVGQYGRGVSFPKLMGAGYLAFTVDPGGDLDRYQGVVPMEGATLSECLHNYFRQSEQLETAIAVFSETDGEDHPKVGVLMLQRLPEEGGIKPGQEVDDDDWRRAVTLMTSATAEEVLDQGLSLPDLLFRLFHEDGVRVFEPLTLRQSCRCSVEKVSATLQSFPKEEIKEMADDQIVTVTCEFCKVDYRFHTDDLSTPISD